MHTRIFNWTRVFLLIGLLASMLHAIPVQASGMFTAPPVPVLVSPATGTVLKGASVVLKWKDNGADHYYVQIALNNTFADLIIDNSNVVGVTYAVTLPGHTWYYWRVKAVNGIGEESNWSKVRKFKTALMPPVLDSPAAGEALFTDRPTFTWDPANKATQYVLQVSAASSFSSFLVNATVGTTQYTMTKDLPQNKTLYWRVRSKAGTVTSAFSAKRTFITGNPPSVPGLLKPANGALTNDYTPLFDWKDSTNPVVATFKQYELEVDDNKDFSSPEIDIATTLNDLTDSTFTPGTDLVSNTKYYWRVRAINTIGADDHTSGWSAVWSFRAAIPAPTGVTVTPTPTALKPTFQWDDATATPSGSISGYTIQISTKADFSTLLVNSTTVNSQYIPGSNLPAGKTLHFRIRVNGANGPSAWFSDQYVTP